MNRYEYNNIILWNKYLIFKQDEEICKIIKLVKSFFDKSDIPTYEVVRDYLIPLQYCCYNMRTGRENGLYGHYGPSSPTELSKMKVEPPKVTLDIIYSPKSEWIESDELERFYKMWAYEQI